MLSLGAFREETLSKMQYRHVQEDLEKGTVPIHVHIESEIVKGKYGDYDTFLAHEAADYLKTYIQLRRQGSPDGRCPREEINGSSALIRDATRHTPRPIGSKQIGKIVHELYAKAGLLKELIGRMYGLRVHSLRKYFKTQMLALGVQSDYVDYMMGHTIDTYHDVQMKGVEFLRNIYAASGISIRPKTKVSKIEALKEIIRAWGMNPEHVLAREALNQPARTLVNPQDAQDNEIRILSKALRDLIRQDTAETLKTVQIRTVDDGPAGN